MGKTAKLRKARQLLQQNQTPISKPLIKNDSLILDSPSGFPSDSAVACLVSAEDLSITIKTLNSLRSHVLLLNSKELKSLRAAVHSFYSAMSSDSAFKKGVTLVGRVSDALRDGRYLDAIACLEEMRSKGIEPKLGSIQRWVRDCDAASTASEDFNILRALDSIIRTTDPKLVAQANEGLSRPHPIRRTPDWKPVSNFQEIEEPQENVDFKNNFRVVLHEPGFERRPANKYDAILYTSTPGTIKISGAGDVKRHDVPFVPGAFVLTNVLSRSECRKIIRAAEEIGFLPDEPIVGTAASSPSILAHNVFWLADSELNESLFERCRPFLPEGSLGINSRWRVYRYVPGAVYRPHIDGAWPGSGLDEVTGEYKYDAWGDRWSKMTFLVRLNDDFVGGATTFFVPANEVGYMNSRGVLTSSGSVVCFPHGVAKGSLLHEGSAVLEGAKYVIRTDVLFKLDK
ncbi:hypothetical protein HK096_004230 [Nowakowskiella sp. JEL0078]|nr:hypothetical protein HK096_004230 [Nowakowskiella sp. JEL0078]